MRSAGEIMGMPGVWWIFCQIYPENYLGELVTLPLVVWMQLVGWGPCDIPILKAV